MVEVRWAGASSAAGELVALVDRWADRLAARAAEDAATAADMHAWVERLSGDHAGRPEDGAPGAGGDVLTRGEVVARLGLSTARVAQLIESGRVVKVGPNAYTAESVEQVIAGRGERRGSRAAVTGVRRAQLASGKAITRHEAAELLGVSLSRVRQLTEKGQLSKAAGGAIWRESVMARLAEKGKHDRSGSS